LAISLSHTTPLNGDCATLSLRYRKHKRSFYYARTTIRSPRPLNHGLTLYEHPAGRERACARSSNPARRTPRAPAGRRGARARGERGREREREREREMEGEEEGERGVVRERERGRERGERERGRKRKSEREGS
jgi:hypothetical protein